MALLSMSRRWMILGLCIVGSVSAHIGISTAPTTSCSLLEDDLDAHMTRIFDDFVATRGSKSRFTTIGGLTGAWVRNTDLWTDTGDQLDWTGISAWNTYGWGGGGGIQRGATLISPRHVIMAAHFPIPNNHHVVYVDSNNVSHTRTIVSQIPITSTWADGTPYSPDITIGVLDSDVPDTVTYYPIIPTSVLESHLRTIESVAFDTPIIVADQEHKNLASRLYHPSGHGPYSDPLNPLTTYSETLIGGDSGAPAFAVIDGQPVLLFTHYSAGGGPAVGSYIPEINAAMASLGGGYQLTVYDTSCFQTYVPNHVPTLAYRTNAAYDPIFDPTRALGFYQGEDVDVGQTLTYSIDSLVRNTPAPITVLDPSQYFSIDPSTGALYQIAALDPTITSLTIRVSVTDDGTFPAKRTTDNIITPMALRLWSTSLDDDTITLTYNAPLNPLNIPPISAYTVKVDGAPQTIQSVTLDANRVLIRLDASVPLGRDVSLTFSGGTLSDLSGSSAAAIGNPGNRVAYAGVPTPGDVDPLFRTSGLGFNNAIQNMARQPDGRILVGGSFTSYNGTPVKHIVRLLPDGTLDPSFVLTGAGLSTISFPGTSGIAVQPDGRIIVIGSFTLYNNITVNRIARLNADGSLDPTFNPGGAGFDVMPRSLLLQPDGRILVGGTFNSYNGTPVSGIVRLNADGSIDPTFVGTLNNDTELVQSIKLGPDGKTYIAGTMTTYNGTSVGRVLRLNADGSIDPTWQSRVYTGTSTSVTIRDFLWQSDGRMIIIGTFTHIDGQLVNRVARLNTDGTLDTSFAAGLTRFGGTGFNSLTDIWIQSDDRIILSGNFTMYSDVPVASIVRLNPDGQLDTTFRLKSSTLIALEPVDSDTLLVSGSAGTLNQLPFGSIASIDVGNMPDVQSPSVIGLTTDHADGHLGVGAEIDISVVMDEDVIVTGAPTLLLETGSIDRAIPYLETRGDHIVFRYTVQAGDNSSDLEVVDTGALSLEGGSIRDLASNDADLLLPINTPAALSHDHTITIDTLAPPEVTIEHDALTNDTTPTISGSCESDALVMLSLSPTGEIGTAPCVQGWYTFAPLQNLSQGSYSVTVQQEDRAGNTSLGIMSTGTIDTAISLPTIVAPDHTSDTTPLVTGTCEVDATIAITFAPLGEIITTSCSPDSTYAVSPINGLSDGVYTTSVTQEDAAHNISPLVHDSGVIDTLAPSLIDVTTSQASGVYGPGSVLVFDLVWSEAIAPSSTMSVLLNTGATVTCTPVSATTMTCSYTIAPLENATQWNLSSIVSVSVSDQATPANVQSSLTTSPVLHLPENPLIAIDTISPSIISVTSALGDGVYTTDTVVPIIVEWSEPVTLVGAPTLLLETGAVDRVAVMTATSGTTTELAYTVQAGDSTSDLSYVIDGWSLPSGTTIADNTGNPALTTLPAVTDARSLVSQKNIMIDTRAPALVTATAQSNLITLTYDEPLLMSPSSSLGSLDFSLSVAGSVRPIQSATLQGSAIVLTLADAIFSTQTVTLTSLNALPVSDAALNRIAPLTTLAVTNTSTAPLTPPPSSGTSSSSSSSSSSTSSSSPQSVPAPRVTVTPPVVEPSIDLNAAEEAPEGWDTCTTAVYRLCPLSTSITTIAGFIDDMVCEGLISSRPAFASYRHLDTATRAEALSIALGMKRVDRVPVATVSESAYQRVFTDVGIDGQPSWIAPVVETALAHGLISSKNTVFRPTQSVTRAEAYAMMMKSVCVPALPLDQKSNDWQKDIYTQAKQLGFTTREWSTFRPNRAVYRGEIFTFASRIADWAETTGGCTPRPAECSAE